MHEVLQVMEIRRLAIAAIEVQNKLVMAQNLRLILDITRTMEPPRASVGFGIGSSAGSAGEPLWQLGAKAFEEIRDAIDAGSPPESIRQIAANQVESLSGPDHLLTQETAYLLSSAANASRLLGDTIHPGDVLVGADGTEFRVDDEPDIHLNPETGAVEVIDIDGREQGVISVEKVDGGVLAAIGSKPPKVAGKPAKGKK